MAKTPRTINVLFVCEHNSARSVLAEALLNRLGAGRFEACSAGFDPAPALSPYALALLHRMPYNTGWLATKPVEAMLSKYAPAFDFIIRLSPGAPASGQWPRCRKDTIIIDWFMTDPRESHTAMAYIARAYEEIYNTLATRLDAMAHLPQNLFDTGNIRHWLENVGEVQLKMAS